MKKLSILAIILSFFIAGCSDDGNNFFSSGDPIKVNTTGEIAESRNSTWCYKDLTGKNIITELQLGTSQWRDMRGFKMNQVRDLLLDAGITQEELDWGIYFVLGGSTCPYANVSAITMVNTGVQNVRYVSLADGAHTIEAELAGGISLPAYLLTPNYTVSSQTRSCITDAEAQDKDPEFAAAYGCILASGGGSFRAVGLPGGGYYSTDFGFWTCRGTGCVKKWGQRR